MSETFSTLAGSPAAATGPSLGRTLFSYLVFAGALIAAVTTVLVRAKRPVLAPVEAQCVGTWYGYIHEGELHYCWRAELRRDRTCQISIRNYYVFTGEEENSADIQFISDDISESRGTWRITGTDFVTETWYPENDPGTVARVWVWLNEQRWMPRNLLTFAYRVEEATPDTFVYTLASEGVTYHAVRVASDFELPDEPLNNEAALAWWNEKHSPGDDAERSSR